MDVTREHVRFHGQARKEAALCWAGTVHDGLAVVTTALVFDTAGRRGGVQVSSAETGLLYAHCYARGLTLLGQVHSHPGTAFHSQVDDASPHSAEVGFLSLVVPYFGERIFDRFDTWCVFEQTSYEQWRELGADEKQRRLTILDSVVRIP